MYKSSIKSSTLNSHIFKTLYSELFAEKNVLLFYTEVRIQRSNYSYKTRNFMKISHSTLLIKPFL